MTPVTEKLLKLSNNKLVDPQLKAVLKQIALQMEQGGGGLPEVDGDLSIPYQLISFQGTLFWLPFEPEIKGVAEINIEEGVLEYILVGTDSNIVPFSIGFANTTESFIPFYTKILDVVVEGDSIGQQLLIVFETQPPLGEMLVFYYMTNRQNPLT